MHKLFQIETAARKVRRKYARAKKRLSKTAQALLEFVESECRGGHYIKPPLIPTYAPDDWICCAGWGRQAVKEIYDLEIRRRTFFSDVAINIAEAMYSYDGCEYIALNKLFVKYIICGRR